MCLVACGVQASAHVKAEVRNKNNVFVVTMECLSNELGAAMALADVAAAEGKAEHTVRSPAQPSMLVLWSSLPLISPSPAY